MIEDVSLRNFYKSISSGHSKFRMANNYLFYVEIIFDGQELREAAKKIGFILEEDIGLLAQSVEVPGLFAGISSIESETEAGKALIIDSGALQPADNTLIIEFLSAENGIQENIFFPWMKEVTSNQYVYADRPFTRASIDIYFLAQQDIRQHYVKYSFKQAYPTIVDTMNGNYNGEIFTSRNVTFNFNWMSVTPGPAVPAGASSKANNSLKQGGGLRSLIPDIKVPRNNLQFKNLKNIFKT
jgi:hypothetical protein